MENNDIENNIKWLSGRGFRCKPFWPLTEYPPPKKVGFASKDLGNKTSINCSYLPYSEAYSMVVLKYSSSGLLLAEGTGKSPNLALRTVLRNINLSDELKSSLAGL